MKIIIYLITINTLIFSQNALKFIEKSRENTDDINVKITEIVTKLDTLLPLSSLQEAKKDSAILLDLTSKLNSTFSQVSSLKPSISLDGNYTTLDNKLNIKSYLYFSDLKPDSNVLGNPESILLTETSIAGINLELDYIVKENFSLFFNYNFKLNELYKDTSKQSFQFQQNSISLGLQYSPINHFSVYGAYKYSVVTKGINMFKEFTHENKDCQFDSYSNFVGGFSYKASNNIYVDFQLIFLLDDLKTIIDDTSIIPRITLTLEPKLFR